MIRAVLDARALVVMALTAIVGTWGVYTFPFDRDNVFLALIELRNPTAFGVLTYGYATLWFTTPFFVASLVASMLTIAVYKHLPRAEG